MSQSSITAVVLVKSPGTAMWEGVGTRKFATLPRINEFIELEIAERIFLYRVVAVVHPGNVTHNAGHIFAVQLGKKSAVLEALFHKV
ncbi:hypothetical protein [Sulfidibacter corallicola]|uniref:Uncharacterized protein n=1 Tax=Sulfidibacter corallicola TaxID=2818388 RepID=A0A8A4TPT5_SULCO|nr:hypothetical protein [Sulfidibacter corallicola]QTD50988.1 hypothetical protein J3U87_00835 [Sulfidibacter corallicola]